MTGAPNGERVSGLAMHLSRGRGRGGRRRAAPGWNLERLERRVLLATDVWTGNSSSKWSDNGNWSLGAPPGTSDVADFTDSGTGSSLLSVTLDEAASISGLTIANSWDGTLTLENPLAVSGMSQVPAGTIDFSSTSSGGSTVLGTLTNTGTLMYGGSTALEWGAAGTITNQGTLDLAAGSSSALANGATLNNAGTINDSIGGDAFELDAGSTVNNQAGGIFAFEADSTFGFNPAAGTFNNFGILKKAAGSGTSALNVNFSNQGGTIGVASGTIEIDSTGGSNTGGNFTVSPGDFLDLTGGQTVTYSGPYTGTGAGTIELDAGTLDVGSGGASFACAAGEFQWSGGAIDTSGGSFTNTGTMALSGASTATEVLEGSGRLINQGTINQTGLASFHIDSPASLNNQTGTYDFMADSGISENSTGGFFTNGGTIEKTAGTGTSTIDSGIAFSDTGSVEAESGTLDIENAGEVISDGTLGAGTWTVAAGATLDLGANITTLGATVQLEGAGATFAALSSVSKITSSGVLQISGGLSFATAGSLDNAGMISLAPAILDVAGSYTQESTGGFDTSVGGTTAGSELGRIAVGTAATLSGNLSVSLQSGFQPTLGQTFTFMTDQSLSGAFAKVSLPSETGPVTLQLPSYGASSVSVASIKNSTTTVTSSANPATVGQSITFTALVKAVAPETGTPTGNVTFFDGTTMLKSLNLTNGSVTYTTSTLALGSHQITVDYGGDPNFAPSDSAVLTQAVVYPTQTMLTSSLNPSVYGQSVTFTATVSSTTAGAGTPAGNVTFMNGNATLQTVMLSNGSATYPTAALKAGTYSITAVYAGSSTFATSTSSVVSQTVGLDGSTAAGRSSSTPSPPVAGQAVTLTATVTANAPGAGTPTGGLIVFKYGSTNLGTSLLQSGTASFSTSALPVGTDAVTVQYQGDSNFKASGPTSFNVTIDKADTTTTVTGPGPRP